tara:strand:- start:560 stop:1396 length:837 start_codon:yes stop_codon:yes gene_type:complete
MSAFDLSLPLKIKLDDRSVFLRKTIIEALESGKRAHLGSAMSILEIIRVLYDDFLNVRPNNINDLKRDRFILSKGHGCLALYAVLANKGFFDKKELLNFCKFNSILGGHPEKHKIPGVEASTGALGHGLSIGAGFAISSKINNVDNKIVVLVGDGEIDEGSIWEASLSINKHKLSNITLMIDYNKIQSYGFVKDVLDLEPLQKKLEAFGYKVYEINGHDINEIKETLIKSNNDNIYPSAIICHSVKGKGFDFAENNPEWHHKSNLKNNEINLLKKSIS